MKTSIILAVFFFHISCSTTKQINWVESNRTLDESMERIISQNNLQPMEGVWDVYSIMEYSGVDSEGNTTPDKITTVGQVLITSETTNNTYIEQLLSVDENYCDFPLGDQTAYFIIDEKNKIASIHKGCGRDDVKYYGKFGGNKIVFILHTGKHKKQTIIQKLVYERVKN